MNRAKNIKLNKIIEHLKENTNDDNIRNLKNNELRDIFIELRNQILKLSSDNPNKNIVYDGFVSIKRPIIKKYVFERKPVKGESVERKLKYFKTVKITPLKKANELIEEIDKEEYDRGQP